MDAVPSAELTMLFTDIEGSTRLLNRLGPIYPDVLASHRDVLRAAFARTGGRELGTEGDSFFVVFGSAGDAVSAAAEGQTGLEAFPWPQGVRLRVRMGLHTGHPDPFEDNLVGFDVHLGARVAATAYGGQVVLSAATADRVRHALPDGTDLLDLGTHRLKDIEEPQRIFQLVVPGLPTSFPALRSLGAPGSLPVAPTALVGRDGELEALTSVLTRPGPRLVTLTGPGGTGKTRLSLAVAAVVAPAYPDGVHFVELASATEPDVAWSTLAETLGHVGDGEAGLLGRLGERDLLLVLDNLEQLPDSGADVMRSLLAGTNRLRVLATSRRPLRVPGEQEYPVPPLDLPDLGPAEGRLEAASRSGAVCLFVQQARLADPGFRLGEDNVADVVALCHRLDGLPLAVELAAARVRLLPTRALLDHLDEALGLPLPGHPERQRTLRAAVDWSYRMVGPREQRAFRALATFGGSGGTFDAVAAVLGEPSALSAVSGLLDAALVRVDDDPAGARVRLLQTVHAVAHDLAAEADELDALQHRHAEHFLAVAEREGDRLKGPDAMASRSALELEMDNVRAALDWALGGADTRAERPADEDRAALGIRLCTALGWYWYVTGYDVESGRWLERASSAASARQGPELARLLHTFALLLIQRGDAGRARDVLAKTLVLWRRAGDGVGESMALNSLGVAYRALGHTDRARELLVQSISVARALGSLQREATALTNLALLEVDTGRPEAALPLLSEAERIDLDLGNAWGVAADRVNLAGALLEAGRPGRAADLLRGVAARVTEHGDPDLALGVVELLAVAAAMHGEHAGAVRLAACADEQRRAGGLPLAEPDRAYLDRHLAASRVALGPELADHEREGRAMDLATALAEADRIPST
ncbi:ATP-binding protein [Oryzobacter telluris]|uniref:ATP-binding protein n=1 Tax=Oryzobacter telluris TaxID=3149179 RepID=UPI00370D880A